MNPSAILAELQAPGTVLPMEALLEAMEQPEAVTPGLLEILEAAAADPLAFMEQPVSNAHLYALYLLAQFREPRALPPTLALLRLSGPMQEAILGDLLTEGMPSILASLCVDTPSALEAAAADPALDPFARGAALDALLVLGFQGVVPEARLEAAFAALLDAFEARGAEEDATAWAFLIIALESAGLAAFLPRLRAACNQGLVDWELVTPAELEEAFFITHLAHRRRRYLRTHHLVEDALLSLEELPWLDPREEEDPEPLPAFTPDAVQVVLARQGSPAAGPSRNGPCPCGSGKKYKHCCGRT